VLLAYFPTKSYITAWADSLHLAEKSGIQDSWWLRSASGAPVSVWPGTQALNIASGWNSYLPQFVHDRILSTGAWDGIFYDEVSADISWVAGGVDLNRDGATDYGPTADAAWRDGMTAMLRTARALDPEKIFVINGSSEPAFQEAVNGRMFETFPTPWEANGDWYEIMRRYIANQTVVDSPGTFIINANTGNTGNQTDYRAMRFALASALLGDAFYSFDYGDQSHAQTWWYDEYDAALGKPAGAPEKVTGTAATADAASAYRFSQGVWQRDYQNGVALVNPTASTQTVTFSSEYEKLRGTQDPATNDGSIVSSVTLLPKDGLVMLRPLDKLTDAAYVNGAFLRIMNAAGTAVRTGFFAYDQRFRGSSQVMETDLDGDGVRETVMADKTQLRIYNADGTLRLTLFPMGEKWKNGLEFAVGDVDGDGASEIVAAAGPGGAPQVKIYELNGKEAGGFLAYNKAFRGGVHLAMGNVDKDAKAEIVTGAGPGGGPHVRVWNEKGIVKYQFFAYAQTFKGGAYVAVGDTTGAGYGQVITGAGYGGAPHVRVFDVTQKNKVVGQFYAFAKSLRSGVRVTSADLDGNGKAEIIGESTDVFTVATADAPAPETQPVASPIETAEPENTVSLPEAPIEPDATDPLIPDRPLFLGTYLNAAR
jgi:hypothetical protein